MKRLLLAITALCLLAAPCYAGPPQTMMMMANSWGGGNSQVAYSGTITSLRISSVDGTAFLDNCAALVPYADGNHLIEIYDATGKQLKGYLSAQGAGETLGAEFITEWTNNVDHPYETHTVNANGHDFDALVNEGPGYGVSITNETTIAQQLYKITLDVTVTSGTAPALRGATVTGVLQTISSIISDGTIYWTTLASNPRFGISNTTNAAFNGALLISAKQVLAPSTSGCLIVSTKGGATQSFATVQAGFAYNAAAYSVVVRKVR